MGQVSRMSRSNRFAVEFHKDYVAKFPLKPGDKLIVKNVNLVAGNQEEVIMHVVLENEQGEEHSLIEDRVYFDPDWSSREDMVEQLVDDLDITEEEALRRMKKVDDAPDLL